MAKISNIQTKKLEDLYKQDLIELLNKVLNKLIF